MNYRDRLNNWLQQDSSKATQLSDFKALVDKAEELFNLLKPTEESIEKGIFIANELLPTTTDPTLVIACLIHPTLQNLGSENWPEQFDTYVDQKNLAMGVTKMGIQQKIQNQTREERLAQSAALRKMLLAMVDDIRVVIIKLCEQTAEVRRLHTTRDPSKRWVAEMGLHVYASLANRLGLGQLKWVLEDLSFRYLEPDIYKEISKSLQDKRTEREAYIATFKETLHQLVQTSTDSERFEISGRVKHIYSIYRKCHRKNHSYTEINDATALRVLLPTVADCYAALSAIHSTWKTEADEFDDYISNPKPNGYRSLHTVIVGPLKKQVEIQLRTFDMHEEAELGVAAHWKYKEALSSNVQNTSNKINWLQSLLNWHEEIDTNRDKSLYREVFQKRVYVFTPDNKIVDLTPGSTPLDFAYQIHTDLGHRCVGAKVNDRIVPLTYQLITGDQVRVLTQKSGKPSRDWLSKKAGYLASSHARSKVRNYFRKEFYQEYVKKGHDIWEKQLGHEKIRKTDLEKLLAVFNFSKLEDLFCNLGSNDLNIKTVINKLRFITGIGEQLVSVKKPSEELSQTPLKSGIVIEGVSNLLMQLARCCHPIPGDLVKGYITKSTGVSIHRDNCFNFKRISQQKPERIIDARWQIKTPLSFLSAIEITATNNLQTDKKIVNYIVTSDSSVQKHSSFINRSQSIRVYQYMLDVQNLDQLQKLITGLCNIPGVESVKRR
jgi:GTP pyrophosphokinase